MTMKSMLAVIVTAALTGALGAVAAVELILRLAPPAGMGM